jgi:hypothetical protein
MPTRVVGAQHQWDSVQQASESLLSSQPTAAAMAGQDPYGRQTPSLCLIGVGFNIGCGACYARGSVDVVN